MKHIPQFCVNGVVIRECVIIRMNILVLLVINLNSELNLMEQKNALGVETDWKQGRGDTGHSLDAKTFPIVDIQETIGRKEK